MNIDISNLMEQAKKLQAELEASKKKTETLTATGEAGAGMVTVTINGINKVESINIADELMDIQNKKMLIDLLVAAFNNAVNNMSEAAKNEMEKMSSKFPFIPPDLI